MFLSNDVELVFEVFSNNVNAYLVVSVDMSTAVLTL